MKNHDVTTAKSCYLDTLTELICCQGIQINQINLIFYFKCVQYNEYC